MKQLINKFIKKPRGMAMIIVLTVVFVVLITVATGATIIVNNLNKSGGQAAKGKSEVSLSVALERLRGMYKTDKALFKGCGVGDCINTTASGCVACTDESATYNSGDIKYQSSISAIQQPEGLNAGFATIDTTSYYKNIRKHAQTEVCLNYCDNNSFDCDAPNGCGGTCGTCTEPDTCGGGGTPQVCGGINCTNIALECDISCPVGSTCGGGTIVDTEKYVVSAPPANCEAEGCHNGEVDSITYQWDGRTSFDTGANNDADGRINTALLDDVRYQAAKLCIDATYNDFSDWYLPAINELASIYSSGFTTGYSEEGCYWSSSQNSSDPVKLISIYGFGARYNDCVVGNVTSPKDKFEYARCARRYADPNPDCTLASVNGDQCGGGTVIDERQHLVASLAGCNGIDSCDEVSDTLTGEWDNSGHTDFTTAQDSDDGRNNMSYINNDPKYVAAMYCETPTYYGFSDWYLPANNEIGIINEAYVQGWTLGYQEGCYWSSTETNFKASAAYKVGIGAANGNCNESGGAPKEEPNYIRCLRRY